MEWSKGGPSMEPCSVDGCEQAATKKGWCVKHYSRWIRHGDPLKVLRGPELPVPAEKTCKRCGETKPIEEFSLGNPGMKGGRASYCRPCSAVRQTEWRVANPERLREHQQRSYERQK